MDYIRFDWAIKRMLRDKANFAILEGLFSVLLDKNVKIKELLESGSNQKDVTDKFNRVDMIVKADNEEIFIIEVQVTRDLYFMQRILYGTSKAITEHIKLGETYKSVKKIISINLIYFDLGRGKDYLYHGKTTFTGCFQKDELIIKKKELEVIDGDTKARFVESNIFPEYYLIRLNKFNEVAKTPIEEWMAFLKEGVIRKGTTTPGLKEAEEKLRVGNMNDEDRKAYYRHLDALMSQNDTIETYKTEGEEIGIAKGLAKGRAEGRAETLLQMAKDMKRDGVDIGAISKYCNLTVEEIEKL
ncbi:MAG: Rpn family recombination-promoting nuclease/putative transposase [Paludibacteraceae bacterium]|nr:Rpn family recombination-promoting nuclease/putative transposase [Paludibacteraceae bacterium]